MTRNIAIIPARGGSKRLPRKNILPFLGKPIIQHTIEAAERSGLFDTVTVSTEDPEIEKAVRSMGCEIHARDVSLATDTARVVHVLRNVLDEYSSRGVEFDCLCCLYPTAPLRDEEDIRASYDLLISRNAEYCLAVTDYELSPFFAFNMDDRDRVERRWPEEASMPPWKRPKVVVDNGSTYWVRVSTFMKVAELEGETAIGYRMPRWKSVDIDTQEDFDLAEFFAQRHWGKSASAPARGIS
jgi:pseudaminic acid cytidylyltransferase